jgi:hypothetical protein
MADTSRGFKKTATTNNIADDINVNLPFNFDKLDEELNNIDKPQYSTVTKQEPVFSLGADAIKGQVPINAKGLSAVNLIKNGNFANGTTNWSALSYGSMSTSSNELIYTLSALNAAARIEQSSDVAIANNKYYLSGEIYPKYANNTYLQIGSKSSETISVIPNKWNRLTDVIVAINSTRFRFYHTTDTNYAVNDTFKYRNIIAIDLTTIFGAGNEPTKEQCDLMFPVWFDSIGGVNDVKIKSVGKNLFDGIWESGYIDTTTGNPTALSTWIRSKNFISIKPSSNIKVGWSDDRYMFLYDINKKFIKYIYGSTLTVSDTSNTYYIKIAHKSTDLNKQVQVEEDIVETTYEPYVESISPLPDLKRVPNGVKDEIVDGKFIKMVGEYTLQASDITTLNTSSFINVDVAYTKVFTDNLSWANAVEGKTLVSKDGGFTVEADASNADLVSNIGKYTTISNQTIGFFVAKGTYADVVAARTAFAGTKILYELAVPIVEDLVTPLTVFPKGTISIESDIETTIPELTLSYPINTAGVIDEVVDGVNQLAKIIYEDVHWDTATLQNGWTGTLQYRKNQIGQLEIKANITAGTVTNGTTISQLPTGYYPAENCAIPTFNAVPNSVSPTSLMLTSTGILSVRITNLVAGSILRFCIVIPMN